MSIRLAISRFMDRQGRKLDVIVPLAAFLAAAGFMTAGLGGCSKSEQPLAATSAASSSLTKDQALYLAHSLSGMVPGSSVTLIQGSSMLPTMSDSAVAVYEPVKVVDAKIGDILIFASTTTGRRIGHRVTAVSPDGVGLITAGDNNRDRDAGVVTDSVVVGRIFALIYFKKETS